MCVHVQEVVQSQVLQAKVFHSPYGTGVAILSGSARFTLAANIDDLKLRRLPEVPGRAHLFACLSTCLSVCPPAHISACPVPAGLQGEPSCWLVLTQDRQTKVLLASGPDLFILDNTSCTAVVREKRESETEREPVWQVTYLSPSCYHSLSSCLSFPPSLSQVPPSLGPQAGNIIHMAVSFSYKYLALFTNTGHLWTGSSHLQVSSNSPSSQLLSLAFGRGGRVLRGPGG